MRKGYDFAKLVTWIVYRYKRKIVHILEETTTCSLDLTASSDEIFLGWRSRDGYINNINLNDFYSNSITITVQLYRKKSFRPFFRGVTRKFFLERDSCHNRHYYTWYYICCKRKKYTWARVWQQLLTHFPFFVLIFSEK